MVAQKKVKHGNGGRRMSRPHAARAREYEQLMMQLGLNQLETGRMFEYAGRTSRRYKRGEGKVPISTLKLMRLMARGVLSKRQVIQA